MKTYLIVALTLVVQVTFAQIRVNVPNGNSRDKKEKHEETSTSDCDFQKGEKVEVYDPIEKKWFASDILKTETNQWYIHYEGYDSKWDTWAKCDFIRRIGTTKAIPSTNSQTQNESQSISTSQSVPIIPTVIPGQKTTLCIGDPIIYTDESTNSEVKLLLTNIELETTPQKSKFYATYNNNGFYYLKDFKLDPNFNYKTLPEVAKISTSEQYQIGDIVETSWRFNEFTEIEIKNGIIVSQDGNNLYVYFEDENGKSQHFAWRYISDIRSIGSSKKLEFETFTQVDISKLQAYQQALNCSSKFPVNWDFLWYYRHDIQGLKTRLSSESLSFLNPENLSDLLVYYECMYQTIKNYPDIGGTGNTINNRFDVQYQFLSNYKSIIKSAFESRINARINAFQSDIKTGFYTYECARNDGQILLENQLKKELTPFESGYLLLNGKITVPSISAAYQEGVSLFTSNLKEIDGLQLDNHLYEGKDARVEQLCINRLKKWCPYATKIMSGCYNNEFLIEYNSLGTPIYRTKSVVLVFESATFRCKVKAHYTIREEFINGKYTDVSFPRDGSLYYYR